jgi:phosphatidylserine synthase
MKKYIYYLPHIVTLAGLGFAVMALFSILENNFPWAARYSLLVLLVDRIDGTLARGLKVKEKLPGISGEILDIITDLVGLTFVPMVLFWKIGLLPGKSHFWSGGIRSGPRLFSFRCFCSIFLVCPAFTRPFTQPS